jgi:hypothetical protein
MRDTLYSDIRIRELVEQVAVLKFAPLTLRRVSDMSKIAYELEQAGLHPYDHEAYAEWLDAMEQEDERRYREYQAWCERNNPNEPEPDEPHPADQNLVQPSNTYRFTHLRVMADYDPYRIIRDEMDDLPF